MPSLLVASLLVAAAVVYAVRACEAAIPPDPIDPAALDLVLEGGERLSSSQLTQLQTETSSVWASCGVALGWAAPPRDGRFVVHALIDWVSRQRDAIGTPALGWTPLVAAGATDRRVVVSAVAATELASLALIDGQPAQALPAALRERIFIRILARALAHEIGHVLLGPAHARAGLMRPRFSVFELIDPSPARFGLSRQQEALARRPADWNARSAVVLSATR